MLCQKQLVNGSLILIQVFTKLAKDVMEKLRKYEVKPDYRWLGIKAGNLKDESRQRRKLSCL
jgi:hypothetical protein